MSKKLFGYSIFALVFALVFSFGAFTVANAGVHPRGVDRDLGIFNQGYGTSSSMFGLDRAQNSAGGAEYDADFRAYNFVPETYGLMGDFWLNQSQG